MQKHLALILFLFISLITEAQVERSDALPEPEQITLNRWLIAGKVVDAATDKGIESASVQLFGYGLHPGMPGKDSILAGTFTRRNGDFSFENFPAADSFRILVSLVGYTSWSQVLLPPARSEGDVITDLGDIAIGTASRVLQDVVVTTQMPALRMGIDRKVFSVEQSITSTGGTALDVMRNIPSVSVDVEGNVQLRNASPQIFVDGRPTILTLDQIQADQIERVELITNPSARYDASGSAGIINVVMKRNRRIGINGVASAGIGHPDVRNANLNLNLRQNKLNFFVSGGFNQSGGIAKGAAERENRPGGTTTGFFNQDSESERLRRFGMLRMGLDFFATNRTTVALTQNFVRGRFGNDEEQQQQFFDAGYKVNRLGSRYSNSNRTFSRSGTQLSFQQRFAVQGRELSGFVNYNRGSGGEDAFIENKFFAPDGVTLTDAAKVRNDGSSNSDQYTMQLDYKTPAGENGKWEAGIRSFINQQQSFFASFSLVNGGEQRLPIGNNYKSEERVHAAYVSFSKELESFSFMTGLRAESSAFDGEVLDSNRKFSYRYPANAERLFDALFPSLFITKKMGTDREVQVNYSRRIRRPNFWQLNPFIDINDPQNLRQGNQELQPEFVNSFEFNYNHNWTKGNFLGVIYYRNNNRDIIRFSDTISAALYQRLNNAAIDPNAIFNTFVNARSTNRLGAELTWQQRLSDQLEIVPTIDMQYRMVNAPDFAGNLTNRGFNWEGKLTVNYKTESATPFWKDFRFQFMGEYESREVTAQGRNLPQYRVDFGLRKDFLKENKATLSFNVNDVFNTHRYANIYDTPNFYQEGLYRRQVRNFRLTLTYKFGQDNFRLFRRPSMQDRGGEDEEFR